MDARIFYHAFNDFGGRVDHLLRVIAAFFLALGLVSGAHAGSVALTLPANVTATATGYATKAAATFTGTANVAFNSGLTTQVAGKAVTVPASWRLAANAGQFAASAVRLNPTVLLGTAVAGWLLTQGLQYVDGQWKKQIGDPGIPELTQQQINQCVANSGTIYTGSNGHACSAPQALCKGGEIWSFNSMASYGTPGSVRCLINGSFVNEPWSIQPASSATPTGSYRPAEDADFAALPQLSPEAATELAAKGQPLPLQNPQVDTAPQQIPLSDPRIDPVTGKKVRDIANVNPSSDGKTANVEIAKQELDPATNQPKTDANGNPEPQIEVKDMCEKNPDAAGCKPLDEVEDQNIENRDISLSIIPLPGFGPGTASCPAPVSLGTKGGQAIQWEWTKFCDFSLGIRPLILAFAWIAAAMIVVGVARKQGA